ncbi:MAG TPA: hypothetical protein VD738_05995 [Nitrospira sp.]|nr:hypothetical protein [Nitrospira sp.]
MWLLIMVLPHEIPGFTHTTVLNRYATSEQCQSARNHVGFEMAAAYPYERDFVMTCQLSPKHGA